MDNAFPREDCSSIRAAREDLTSDFLAFLSMEAACELTLTEEVLKEVSVAFSLAGARFPTLALGRLAKSFAGWCFDGFLGGAMAARDQWQSVLSRETNWHLLLVVSECRENT